MAVRQSLLLLTVTLLFLAGCSSYQHLSQSSIGFDSVGSSTGLSPDADIEKLIAPYKVQLDDKMNEVIGEVDEEMTKAKPESELGNWICDAIMAGIRQHGFDADLALSNYGGIRVNYITPGPLTIGEIYELSPFDNLIVIVDIPGEGLDSLFQHIAGAEGWPVSANLKMVIQNQSLASAAINGKAIDRNTIYRVAMPDYVANGGDGSKLLIDLSRVQTGLLARDLIIEHAKATTATGGKIRAPKDGRIVIQK